MPRKEQILTIEQIDEILEGRPSEETWNALLKFLKAEKQRRKFAGNTGGKPRKYEGDLKERNRQAAAKYRESKNLLQNKEK